MTQLQSIAKVIGAAVGLGMVLIWVASSLYGFVVLALAKYHFAFPPGSLANFALELSVFALPGVIAGMLLALLYRRSAVAIAAGAGLISVAMLVVPPVIPVLSSEFAAIFAAPLIALLASPLVGTLLVQVWGPTPPSSGQPPAAAHVERRAS